jgi:pimeloyl-ACP methyl ester carboxylesterase
LCSFACPAQTWYPRIKSGIFDKIKKHKKLSNMKNYRTYGKAPFGLAVIHGGPGAAVQMAPVARELSRTWSVLEPLQTAASLEGQVEELRNVLENKGDLPVILIGSSWGAMLGYIFSAYYPSLVKKLFLIGSAVYQEQYATAIEQTRLNRLHRNEQEEAFSIINSLKDPSLKDKDNLLSRLAALYKRADVYNPLNKGKDNLKISYEINKNVWNDAVKLRSSGELLELGKKINCPVIAIHGDYDPHPAEGVEKPLSKILKNFKFILLKNCGHLPWIEREARDIFFKILKKELRYNR